MAISIFLGSGAGFSAASNGKKDKLTVDSLASTSTFAGTARISTPENARASDKISLSGRQSLADRSSAEASRTISDATGYTRTAKSAANQLFKLAGKLDAIATQLEGVVLGSDVDDLEQQADDILTEIDSIVNSAEFNGESVINSGGQSFSYDFASGDESSNSNASIFVGNVGLDRASLGIDGLSGASIVADPTAARESLEEAGLRITQTQESLEDSEAQANNAVAQLRDSRTKDAANEATPTDEEQAAALAQKITKSVENVVEESDPTINELDSGRVQQLLGVKEDDEKEDSKTISALPTEEETTATQNKSEDEDATGFRL